MSQSTFGKKFTVTTWGESHGKALGTVVDGVPAGLFLTEADIQAYLNRRKPGQSRYTTARNEGDEVEILSGVFEGQTTGTPISMIVRNKDQRSRDCCRSHCSQDSERTWYYPAGLHPFHRTSLMPQLPP